MTHLYLEKLISYCKDFLNVKKGQVWKYNLIKEIDLDICYSKTTLLSVDSEWCEIRALLVVFSLEAVQCTYTVCPFAKLFFIILCKQLPKSICLKSLPSIFWWNHSIIIVCCFGVFFFWNCTITLIILFSLRNKKKDSMKNFQEKFTKELIIVMLPIVLIGSQGCFWTKTLVMFLIISEQENLKKHCRIAFPCFDNSRLSSIRYLDPMNFAVLFSRSFLPPVLA